MGLLLCSRYGEVESEDVLLEELAGESVLPEEDVFAWLKVLVEGDLEGVVVDLVDLEVRCEK